MQVRHILYLLVFVACQPSTVEQADQPFYDVREMIDRQITILDSLNPLLHKIAFLESDVDSTTFRPDSVGWSKELEIFLELDINRPVLRDKFKLTESYDPSIDMKISTYSMIDQEETGVQYLNIYRHNDKLVRVEGEYQDNSLLYSAYRLLNINFESISNESVIVNYSIDGWQKIILKDTIYYHVKGSIMN